LANVDINSSQVYSGIPNPNVTPPPSYGTADFYVQVDAFNDVVAVFLYDGNSWLNLTEAIQNALTPSFLALTDTPDTYAGQATKKVVVKADESGLEFVDDTGSTPTLQEVLIEGNTAEDVAILMSNTTNAKTSTIDSTTITFEDAATDDNAGVTSGGVSITGAGEGISISKSAIRRSITDFHTDLVFEDPTANREIMFQDADGVVAFLSDITGGATNLGYTPSPTDGIVTSDTGTDATLPLADATNAGLLKPAKYTVLENTSGTNTGDQTLASLDALKRDGSNANSNVDIGAYSLNSRGVAVSGTSEGMVLKENVLSTSRGGLYSSNADQAVADIDFDGNSVGDILYRYGNGKVAVNETTDETLITTSSVKINGDEIATQAYVASSVAGLLDYRSSYDASTNLFPTTGGSGIAGAVLKGDFWICSVAGTLGGVAVTPGDLIIAIVDTPAQTAANWDLISNELGYVAENEANKTDVMAGNTASSTKYLSAKGVYDWATGLFATITNLALKADKSTSAYKFKANSTNATADEAEHDYREEPNQTYAGSIAWTGTTAPSGATTHTYRWIRVGNLVTLNISLSYAVAGSALTMVTMAIPSDCPNPLQPSGYTGASEVLYCGVGRMGATKSNATIITNSCYLRNNAANNGFEVQLTQGSGSNIFAMITVQYFTS